MKLANLFEKTTIKQRLLKLQTQLIDQGWDDVELEHIAQPKGFKLTLVFGASYKHSFHCDLFDDDHEGWTDDNDPSFSNRSDHDLLEAAKNNLGYVIVKQRLKVKFYSEPNSFQEIIDSQHVVDYSRLHRYVEEGLLQVIPGTSLYSISGRPASPLTAASMIRVPPMFIASFDPGGGDLWLIDSTDAVGSVFSYFANWARVVL